MVSTLIVLALAASSLVLAWTILRPGLPEIRDLDDWEAKRHEVGRQAFRMLLDGTEQRYLRTSLPPRKFREFQRKRTALALQSLNLVGKNAQMLMKLGNLAKMGADPALAKQADDLIHGALRLRVNLLLIQPYLWLKWLFPGGMLPLPAFEMPYEELAGYFSRIRQQRQWDLKQALTTS